MKKYRFFSIIIIFMQIFFANVYISQAIETDITEQVTSEVETLENEKIEQNNKILENDTLKEECRTIEDGTYIIRTVINTKYGLDVSQASAKNEANIQLFEYVKENQQKFNIEYIGEGYYKITALHSGKVLDVAGAGKTAGTNVWQYEINNSDAQKWLIKDVGNGIYNIISKCNGLYLDVAYGQAQNRANIQVYSGNGTNAQNFIFEPVTESDEKENVENNETISGTQTIADGTYAIKTAIDNKYGLDVIQASARNSANIQLFQYKKQSQQKFNIEYIGDGYYKITALHSGKVLDVAGAGKVQGTNVWQYELNNSDAQKWVIKEAGDGYYNIISKCNGLYLDVANGQAKNGSNIQVYSGNGTNAQKFKFERTILDGTYSIQTAINNKYVLDVSQASKANGANIQLFEDVKEEQQRFNIKYVEDGYYTITALHSGKALEVENAEKAPKNNVCQNEINNLDSQKWKIKELADGTYNIISKCNGLYLDVAYSEAKNGTNIQVYTANGTNAQKFKFDSNAVLFEEGTYGKSGLAIKGDSRGNELRYYKFGKGENVLFTTFSIHGFEDGYAHDGCELTYIAEEFKSYLLEMEDNSILKNWTIYVLPELNPDGQRHGKTHNGEGRTTLYSAAPNNKGIDMNRNFQTSTEYIQYADDRNYNGTEAFQAYEARYLRDFLLNNKSQNGQTILIDLHGWLNETIGNEILGKFYQEQYGITRQIYTYGQGYLINWARMSLGNSNNVAKSALIELPKVSSHEELVNKQFAQKYINATMNMLESMI